MEKQVASFLLCGVCMVYAREHGGSCTLHTHEELVQNRAGLALISLRHGLSLDQKLLFLAMLTGYWSASSQN